jgi:hypothetical protein
MVHPMQILTFAPCQDDIGAVKVMSALPPKADMCSALGDVRFVPLADIRASVVEVRYATHFWHLALRVFLKRTHQAAPVFRTEGISP